MTIYKIYFIYKNIYFMIEFKWNHYLNFILLQRPDPKSIAITFLMDPLHWFALPDHERPPVCHNLFQKLIFSRRIYLDN